MPHNARVPGTAAAKSYVVPVCSSCGARCQKDENDQWFCEACADDWLKSFVAAKERHSIGGVELPARVHDERKRTPTFRHLVPNRHYRRAMKKAR